LIYVITVADRLRIAERQLRQLTERLDAGAVVQDVEVQQQTSVPQPASIPVPAPKTLRAAAKLSSSGVDKLTADVPVTQEEPEPKEPGFMQGLLTGRLSFEELVGEKLPIWVGGIALVFAAFFLVRYSIEAGLLGPAARSVVAAIFAAVLIALSELGGRLPKIGAAFDADPRVGQSLAGAGVAILFGTLYMASEVYGLIGVGTAFGLVITVTALAFALSLRQGPPTAVMGVVGGFAAPWVAGMNTDQMPSLLMYLAVFIAAVFGLAVWRRWLWLLLLASGGGVIWTASLAIFAQSDLHLLGLFVLFAGIGAMAAFTRFEGTTGPAAEAARYLPMAAALVQLTILLSRTDFSASSWLYFGTITALTILLGWRDQRMIPLAAGALILALIALIPGWDQESVSNITYAASTGVILLFGIPAMLRGSKNHADDNAWAVLFTAAVIAVWLIAATSDAGLLYEEGIAAAILALPLAWLAYTARGEGLGTRWITLTVATAGSAFLALAAFWCCVNDDHYATTAAIVALGIAAWAARVGKAVRRLTIIPLALSMIAMLIGGYKFIGMLLSSLVGQVTFFDQAPTIGATLVNVVIPALLILAIAWRPWFAVGNKTRLAAQIAGGTGLAAFAYLLAKTPASIDTAERFVRYGFAERMAITQMLAFAGWAALHFAPKWPQSRIPAVTGMTLGILAALRFVVYDLVVVNPVFIDQAIGALPLANLAAVHTALIAMWCWLYARTVPSHLPGALQKDAEPALRLLGLGAMILTVLVTVRQISHGSILTEQAIFTGENYMYSAGLLMLAIAWLARGMTGGSKLLRMAGLALLTAVTLKVFLIDAAALSGVLRIFSFLGLGIALIGIGWAYGRVMAAGRTEAKMAEV
jgi:uncharacterized membrane protein